MNNMSIYEFLTTIPKGKVVSYKTIAQKFHIHPRTVGIIMGQNQEPDKYPCYKVLRSDWTLWGYSTTRWCEEKMERLEKDGIEIKNNKVGKKFFICIT
jgi:alkylated DNA nucleotide flippase Atl1